MLVLPLVNPLLVGIKKQDLDEDTEEECRRLRKLQAFRERNAYDLISLPSARITATTSTTIDTSTTTPRGGASNTDTDDSENKISQRGSHHHKNNTAAGVNSIQHRRRHRHHLVPYRRNHLTCSLTPTVSCSKLDHTRPGHPSDAPPLVSPEVDDDVNLADLTIRLVIPNPAPTSIRSADQHRLCMALATDQGGDSLSIAHQRMGLEAGGRDGGSSSSGSYGQRQRRRRSLPHYP